MDKLKRVVIKEEYVAITGDTLEAIILNQIIYWSERVNDFDKFIKEEKERFSKFNDNSDNEPPETELTNGWIYKKASEIKEEIMSTDSEKTISRKMISLVEKGFLDRRNNPKYKYDRTYQYRVNFANIIKAMLEKGYVMQDYKVDLNFIAEALNLLNGQNDDSIKIDNEESNRQIDDLKRLVDDLRSQIVHLKSQGDEAIPEITPKITSNITTDRKDKGTSILSNSNINIFYDSLKKDDAITDVSFKTWIEPLEIKQVDDKIIIAAPSDFVKGIVQTKYLKIIKKHLEPYYAFKDIEITII